jgi:hypothetical protein
MQSKDSESFVESVSSAEASIILKTYQLYRRLNTAILKFPKPWRYSLGEKIQTGLLDIIESAMQGLQTRQPLKETYILKTLGHIKSLQIFIRLCSDEKLITENQYFSYSDQAVQLLKMAIGWLRSTRTPVNTSPRDETPPSD